MALVVPGPIVSSTACLHTSCMVSDKVDSRKGQRYERLGMRWTQTFAMPAGSLTRMGS